MYRNRRVNGKPVKEYLAADDRYGFGALIADELDQARRQRSDARQSERRQRPESRARVEEVVAQWRQRTPTCADADGLLVALGYLGHNRRGLAFVLECCRGPEPENERADRGVYALDQFSGLRASQLKQRTGSVARHSMPT